MSPALLEIPAYADDGALRVIVECPRGSCLKFDYDAEHGVFEVGRPLPLGMSYPFDWGFIPGTRAPDGDPIDALMLNDVATYPGVLIPGDPGSRHRHGQAAGKALARQRARESPRRGAPFVA